MALGIGPTWVASVGSAVGSAMPSSTHVNPTTSASQAARSPAEDGTSIASGPDFGAAAPDHLAGWHKSEGRDRNGKRTFCGAGIPSQQAHGKFFLVLRQSFREIGQPLLRDGMRQ